MSAIRGILDSDFIQFMTGGYGAKRERETQQATREQYKGLLAQHTDAEGNVGPQFYREVAALPGMEGLIASMASNDGAMHRQQQQQEFAQERPLSQAEQYQFDNLSAAQQAQVENQNRSFALQQQQHNAQMGEMQRQQELAGMPPIFSMSPMEALDFESGMTSNLQRVTDARAIMDDIRSVGTSFVDNFDNLGESRRAQLTTTLLPIIEEEIGRPLRREEMEPILAPLITAATWSTAEGAKNATNYIEGIIDRAEQRAAQQYQGVTGMQLPTREEWGIAPSFRGQTAPTPAGTPRSVEPPRNSRGQMGRNR